MKGGNRKGSRDRFDNETERSGDCEFSYWYFREVKGLMWEKISERVCLVIRKRGKKDVKRGG